MFLIVLVDLKKMYAWLSACWCSYLDSTVKKRKKKRLNPETWKGQRKGERSPSETFPDKGICPHIRNFLISSEDRKLTNLETWGTFPFLVQWGMPLWGFTARELNYTTTEMWSDEILFWVTSWSTLPMITLSLSVTGSVFFAVCCKWGMTQSHKAWS